MSLDKAMVKDLFEVLFYTILLTGAASLFALLLTATIIHLFRKRSLPPIRDVIIVAPHQDDCLILAGEYALAAIEASKTVRVIYTTCGDSEPSSDRSKQRNGESISAWSQAGVERGQLTFLGLPQSDVSGPSVWTEADEHRLQSSLRELFRAAPAGAAVIIPAGYESHIDHRNSRTAALIALIAAGRSDIVLLECAEYNRLFNLLENPGKSLAYVCSNLFVVSRITARVVSVYRQGFASLGPLLQLQHSSDRRARKRALMRYFTSEYNAMLDRLARQPEVYRLVNNLNAAALESGSEIPRGYVRVKQRMLHWSTIVAWLAISWLFLTCSIHLFRLILASPLPFSSGVAALLIATLSLECWRRRGVPERFITAASALLGGLVACVW